MAVRLSVVIPAHDAETTLPNAIRSALAQTVLPDEVVVVDDGSVDGTAAAAARFGPPVRVIHQDRQGPSAARNAGVAASGGEWVAFLDADDEWHPAKLERQLEAAGEGIALVATDWSRALTVGAPPAALPRTAITTTRILLLNRFQTSTVLLSRRAFDAAGGFDPSLDGVEDWDMWLRASEHGAVVKLDWPFVRYTDVATGYSKVTERVYRTGRVMLDRRLGPEPGPRGRAVLAWHQLRFAVAFALAGDRVRARECLAECHRSGLVTAVPEAAVRYLAPFLAGRARRRLSMAGANR